MGDSWGNDSGSTTNSTSPAPFGTPATPGKWAKPKDGEPHEKQIDGEMRYYCAKCNNGKGRWTKNHKTDAHKTTEQLADEKQAAPTAKLASLNICQDLHTSRNDAAHSSGAVSHTHQPLESKSALPDALSFDTEWLVQKLYSPKPRRCIHFGNKKKGGCWKGHECHFSHIQGPFESWLHEYNPRDDRLESSSFAFQSAALNGGEWFTAGYLCPHTNVFLHPEQNGGIRLPTGVWWYTSKEEARKALVSVIATSRQFGWR